MIIGIYLHTKNDYSFIIKDIFAGIDLHDLVWDIGYTRVYPLEDSISMPQRFTEKFMTNEIFMQKAGKLPEYYPLFVEFKAFSSKESIKPIKTYIDFLESDCQLIFLISDRVCVDIYAKSKDILEQIKKNAEILDCKEIEYITDENDERRAMFV